MIKIYPGFGVGRGGDLISNGNAKFSITRNYELVRSYPAGFYAGGDIDDAHMLIHKDSSNYYIYNFITGRILEERPSEGLIRASRDEIWAVDRDCWPEKTKFVREGSGLQLEVPGKYNYVAYESEDFLIVKARQQIACISKSTGRVEWSYVQEGQLWRELIDGSLVYYKSDTKDWTTTIVFRELETGKIRRTETLSYSGHIAKTSATGIVLIGTKVEGKRGCTAFIHYDWADGIAREIPLDDSHHYLGFYGGKLGVYCLKEKQMDVWKAGGQGCSFVGAIDPDSGEQISKIELPNVCFPEPPGFSVSDGVYFAAGVARTPWPVSYWQMILWDERDFYDPRPDVYQEPLMGDWERVEDSGKSLYRVFVPRPCENFFQLHRQISVALHQCGALYGFHRNSDLKDRDDDFSGKIVCDVSNHSLDDLEKLAIKNLCGFIESELDDGGFRSSYDPANRIEIELRYQ